MPPKEQSKLNDFNTIGMPSLIGPHVFRNRASRIRNWFLRIIKNSSTMFRYQINNNHSIETVIKWMQIREF